MRWLKESLFILILILVIHPVLGQEISSWNDPLFGREAVITTEEITEPIILPDEEGILPAGEGVSHDTSLYLIGNVSVGIIYVQGPGETWTQEQMQEVYDDIEDGQNWISSQEPRATIYRWRRERANGGNPVLISKRPTVDCAAGDDSCWINEVMGNLGYTPSKDGIYEYIEYLRNQRFPDTVWGYVIFNVLGVNFSDGTIAYVPYTHGPYFVMTQGLGGRLEKNNLRRNVTAHETMHIFGAEDEYFGETTGGCSCCGPPPVNYGYDYQTVPNIMCERGCFSGKEDNCLDCVWGNGGAYCNSDLDCNEEIEFCELSNPSGYHRCKHRDIMVGPSSRICPFSRAQVGWRDCDNDNILDPLEIVESICGYPSDTDGTGEGSINYLVRGNCSGGCDYTSWSCGGTDKIDYCIDETTLAEYIFLDIPAREWKSDTCAQSRKNCTEIGAYYSCYAGMCKFCLGDVVDSIPYKVEMNDVVAVINAYGSVPSDPNWNSNADQNADGGVTMDDMIVVINNYDKTCS